MVLDMRGKPLLTLDDTPVKDIKVKTVEATESIPEHEEFEQVNLDMQRSMMHILGNAQNMDPRDASALARKMKRTGQIDVEPSQLKKIQEAVEQCQVKRGNTAENFFTPDMKGQLLEEIQSQIDASRKGSQKAK